MNMFLILGERSVNTPLVFLVTWTFEIHSERFLNTINISTIKEELIGSPHLLPGFFLPTPPPFNLLLIDFILFII